MVIAKRRRAVGVFPSRQDAERALQELTDLGFPMESISVIARDVNGSDLIPDAAETRDRLGNKADEGARIGAISGGALGGLTGLLVGLGTLAIPGIGPIMLAGSLATAIATTLAGAGIGAAAGGLIGSLIGLGIPEERARVYHDRVQQGDYLVIIDGTEEELARAQVILHDCNIEEFGIYDYPNEQSPQVTPQVIPQVTPPVTAITTNSKAIGYFALLSDAEAAINELRNAGLPIRQISLIHKDTPHRDAWSGANLSDRLESLSLGLPDQLTHLYQERINQGNYIIVVSGTDADKQKAATILSRYGIQEWQIYQPSQASSQVSTQLSTQLSSHHQRAIGVSAQRQDLEAALADLRTAGFPMDQVSLIAKDTNGNEPRNINNNLRTEEIVSRVPANGAVSGLTFPGVGRVIAGGKAATAVAAELAKSTVGNASEGIAGVLPRLGISPDRAQIYSDRFQRGDFLLFIDGTATEISRAEAILRPRKIAEFAILNTPNLN